MRGLIFTGLLLYSAYITRGAGVTIITHGFNDSTTGWVDAMADTIIGRLPLYNGTLNGSIIRMYVTQPTVGGPLSVSVGPTVIGDPLQKPSGEIVVELDWSPLAGHLYGNLR